MVLSIFRVCITNNSGLNLLGIWNGDRIEQKCGLRDSCLTFKNIEINDGFRSSWVLETGGRIFYLQENNQQGKINEMLSLGEDLAVFKGGTLLCAQLACGLLYKT